MTAVHFDARIPDAERRRRIYEGDIFVYSPTPQALELIELARQMIVDAFGGSDPELAQHDMPVKEFATLLGELKPRFIHHPQCKQLLPRLLAGLGCDLGETYFDV